ncbi:juvenile hormone binding protein 15 [Cochliomyia hominivorax]
MNSRNILWFLIALTYGIFSVNSGELPPEIQKCKSSNNDECVARTIEEVIKLYPQGNPTFGMANMQAINLTDVVLSKLNPNSPIQINIKFNKCTLYGLEKVKVLRAKGFSKKTKKIFIDIFVPNLKLKGDYESKGKILLLPLNGRGNGEMAIMNATIKIEFDMDSEKRNDKIYYTIKDTKSKVETEKMIANLENILMDNPILSESINSVINENWKEVFMELHEDLEQIIKNVTNILLGDVLKELTEDDFFLD